ncbi:9690_t:CDS:1, partial [Funneliformis geosporum]
ISALTETQCDFIGSPYHVFMKKKLHLSRDTPSSVLHSNLFYNLINLHHWLFAAQNKALLFSLNDRNILGDSTRLRMRQLQQKEWLHISPLHS